LPWIDVQITVSPCSNNPQWLGWVVESNGQTPWEGAQVAALKGAQVAALEVLLENCQDFGDELVNGLAGTFPRVSVIDIFVSQVGTEPLEMREAMLGYSSSPARSAMLVVLKLYYMRQDTYIEAMLTLQQAQAGQRKLRKRVRKHRKAFSDAQAKIQNYHTVLQACRNQVKNAVRERNEAQARMMQVTRERDAAMRLTENREAARVRALFQAEVREQELIHRIAELQLDVHRLNNVINPIPHPVPVNHKEDPSEEDQDDGMISNEESEDNQTHDVGITPTRRPNLDKNVTVKFVACAPMCR